MVEVAVAGGQTVINVLTPGLGREEARASSLMQGTQAIVAAMEAHEIQRYISHGHPAVGLCPHDQPTIWVRWRRFLTKYLRPRAHHQQVQTREVITTSGLDWTIVRFLRTRPENPRGLKYVGFFGDDGVGRSATEADIARFTAAQVLETAHIGSAPAVSN